MKHIKVFENKNDELWVVTRLSTISPDDFEMFIFDDEKSAENYYIYLVNDLVQRELYSTDKDYVFSVVDAEKIKGVLTYNVDYFSSINYRTFELPEELKIGYDSQKYNL